MWQNKTERKTLTLSDNVEAAVGVTLHYVIIALKCFKEAWQVGHFFTEPRFEKTNLPYFPSS